jgi:hypothetical protein
MAIPKLDDFWISKIYESLQNEPEANDQQIGKRVRELEKVIGREDGPTVRTINNYRRKFDSLPEDARARYVHFKWPESCELGHVPWEAGPAGLQLLDINMALASLMQTPPDNGGSRMFYLMDERPSICRVKWYWRISQVAPGLPPFLDDEIPGRYELAMAMATCEAAENISKWLRDALEAYLAYTPWVPERRCRYFEDADKGRIPELTTKELYTALDPYSISLAVLRERFGPQMAEIIKPDRSDRAVLPEEVAEEDKRALVN